MRCNRRKHSQPIRGAGPRVRCEGAEGGWHCLGQCRFCLGWDQRRREPCLATSHTLPLHHRAMHVGGTPCEPPPPPPPPPPPVVLPVLRCCRASCSSWPCASCQGGSLEAALSDPALQPQLRWRARCGSTGQRRGRGGSQKRRGRAKAGRDEAVVGRRRWMGQRRGVVSPLSSTRLTDHTLPPLSVSRCDVQGCPDRGRRGGGSGPSAHAVGASCTATSSRCAQRCPPLAHVVPHVTVTVALACCTPHCAAPPTRFARFHPLAPIVQQRPADRGPSCFGVRTWVWRRRWDWQGRHAPWRGTAACMPVRSMRRQRPWQQHV